MNKFTPKLILLLVSPLVLYFFTMEGFFTYLTQSSLTPKENQLTFLNYALPFFLTIGFIIYLNFFILYKDRLLRIKHNWIRTIIICVAAIIAIPWQMKYFKFIYEIGNIDFLMTSAHVLALVYTLWTVGNDLMAMKKLKEKN